MGSSNVHTTTRGILWALVLLSCAAAWKASALDPNKVLTQYVHDAWDTADGLPQASVQDLIQSRDGYIWFGTQEGLVRFDGVRFDVFDKQNTSALTTGNISCIIEDVDGVLWIGTTGGGLLRAQDGEFTAYTTQQGLSSNVVLSLLETASGDIWIGTDAGLNLFRDGHFTIYTTADGLPHDTIPALVQDRHGRVWAGTQGGGIGLVDKEQILVLDESWGLSSNSVRALLSAEDGSVWIGTDNGGLSRYKDGTFVETPKVEELGADSVYSLAEDGDGNLWVGTANNGLIRCRQGMMSLYSSSEGLTHDRVSSLMMDREGSLWIGTFGGGLNRLRDTPFTTYGAKEGLSSDHIWSVFEDREDCLWIGTQVGLDMMVDGIPSPYAGRAEMEGKPVMALFQDGEGRLWVGTHGYGLWRLQDGAWTTWTEEHGLADNIVFTINQDANGTIWAGTQAGLTRIIDDELHTFTTADGLPHDNIRGLQVDGDNTLWIGTRGAGLARYVNGAFETIDLGAERTPNQLLIMEVYLDGRGGLWLGTPEGLLYYRDGETRQITTQNGLYDDTVHRILEDDIGNLWISCNHGIYRISRLDLERFSAGTSDQVTSESYGRADGMRNEECNGGYQPAGWRTMDGRLWFPTIDGLVSLDPSDIRSSDVPPPVLIERVHVDAEPIDPDETPILPAGASRFEFHYNAPTFLDPDKVQFRVRLDGLDDDWVDAGTRRIAYFTQLNPGEYTFNVTACNSDGVWNENGATFSFVLQPRFYQRPLFYGFCALLVVTAALGMHGMRVRQLRVREKELLTAVHERTVELRQMARELKELALRDPLTGLRNRRYLFETITPQLDSLRQRHRREVGGSGDRRPSSDGEVMGLFMVDIDHFKRVNDELGHDAGDVVLQQFAQVLASCARTNDVVVRWGGEEFLLVLPRTGYAHLTTFADRVRATVEKKTFKLRNGHTLNLTCSIGYTSFPVFFDPKFDMKLDHVISLADLGLMAAKQEGRNRIIHVIAGERMPLNEGEVNRMLGALDWAEEHGFLRVERQP